jgi:hypothetical protein
VVADAFDDGVDAGVAHGEALARHAADVGLAGGGAVEATLPMMMFSSALKVRARRAGR